MRATTMTCCIANSTFLLFDVDDFNGASVGGEWLLPLGEFFEGGIGVELLAPDRPQRLSRLRRSGRHRSRTGPALRMVPVAFTVRLRCHSAQFARFQPYIGAGLGVINWRYSESR